MTPVGVEIGTKRVFAWAYDWPGWCRSARSTDDAIQALVTYLPRYAAVAQRAGLPLPDDLTDRLQIVEQLPGDATTDFGAPGAVATADSRPLDRPEAGRLTALLAAAWELFDEVAADSPAELRKGPRGGGRDRDRMIEHVLAAEAAYARKYGIKHRAPAVGDTAAVTALRTDLLTALRAGSDGTPPLPKGWPARYLLRRVAWHVLDHAWEMQDRRTSA